MHVKLAVCVAYIEYRPIGWAHSAHNEKELLMHCVSKRVRVIALKAMSRSCRVKQALMRNSQLCTCLVCA